MRYAVFAGISTVTNLAVQALTLSMLRPAGFALAGAMAAGTFAGFSLKYLLDKRWIFFNPTQGLGREVRQVTLYGAFSVGTTALFWGMEMAFTWVWRTDVASIAGAAIGLTLGYAAKYALDRRFTFGPAA